MALKIHKYEKRVKKWIKNGKETENTRKICDQKMENTENKWTKDKEKMENSGKKCDALKNKK